MSQIRISLVGLLCDVDIEENKNGKISKFELACTHEEWFRGAQILYFFQVMDKQPDAKTEFILIYDPPSNVAIVWNTKHQIHNVSLVVNNKGITIPSSCTWMETAFVKAQQEVHNLRIQHLRESAEGSATALYMRFKIVNLL